MTVDIEKLEEIVLQIRCGEILNDGEAADLLDDAIGEIERLRVALKKIAEVNPDDTSSRCWVVKVANAALVTPNAGSNGPSGVAAKVRVD